MGVEQDVEPSFKLVMTWQQIVVVVVVVGTIGSSSSMEVMVSPSVTRRPTLVAVEPLLVNWMTW